MKTTFKISGLDCANCARELEEKLVALNGVQSATVSFIHEKITLVCDGQETLDRAVEVITHFEDVKIVSQDNALLTTINDENHKKEWILIAISALFFVVGIFCERMLKMPWQVCAYISYGLAYLPVGVPILIATGKNIAHGRIFDENFLMTVASVGAVCLGEYFEGVAVVLLYQIGETLQGMAVRSSRRSITHLMELKSEYATLLVQEERVCACGHCHTKDPTHVHDHAHKTEFLQKQVTPETLRIDDVVLVKAGEKVPVDGILLTDTALIDTKALTGEAALKRARRGEEILSGCINTGEVFTMRVTRAYDDSAVGKILEMVENASVGKAKPEKFITKFAKYYTPIVCLFALVLAVFCPFFNGLVIGKGFRFVNAERWIQSALTFLVVSCPCALIISVPLTYFAGMGECAKRGILVKGAIYLEALSTARTVAFDKTGTLTEGNFTVCAAQTAQGVTEEELLSTAAAVERFSAHPIAKAFEEISTAFAVERAQEVAGRGVVGYVDGQEVLVGNAQLLAEKGVKTPDVQSPYTLVYVSKAGAYLGVIEVGDKIRTETKPTLLTLKRLGKFDLAMLTGDNAERAKKIADEVGMDVVFSGLLPDGKLKIAQSLQQNGGLVYVGDGINDAPVMRVADCAVSMGKLGSAAAVEASDLVLISDNLSALCDGVKISKKTRRIVLQNIVGSIVMKCGFMVLGAFGVLPLWLAVFADVGVMLVATLNALRVRKKIK